MLVSFTVFDLFLEFSSGGGGEECLSIFSSRVIRSVISANDFRRIF